MKRFLQSICALLAVVAILILPSCSEDITNEIDFTQSDLVGTWQSGTLYETYYEDLSGSTWDTADDVTEDEAQKFTWTLDQDNLVQIHIMSVGGEIPRSYTVTELTATTFVYEDSYGRSTSFTRVK